MRHTKNPLFLVGIVLALIILGGIVFLVSGAMRAEPSGVLEESEEITFFDYNDTEVHISDFTKKRLVVHVWASWCSYCAEEITNLARVKGVYGDDITILAINRAEPKGAARTFSDALGVSDDVTFLLDPEDAFYKTLGGYAMPETVLFNQAGEMVYHHRGPLSFEDMIDAVNEFTAPN